MSIPTPETSMPTDGIVGYLVDGLRASADVEHAVPMAAYMKTSMPFYGVKAPQRRLLLRAAKKRWKPVDAAELRRWVTALWERKHREEKYLAIDLARAWPRLISAESMPLYERMVREGSWWDLVDDIATNLVGAVWRQDREAMSVRMDRWIDDTDLWIRRTAVIGQLKHKDEIDQGRLFRYALARAHEKEFFMRKAIGWALRQHAKQQPTAVTDFLLTHRDRWAGLTWREASKHLAI